MKKILRNSVFVVCTLSTMLFMGTIGAFGECGSPMPTCQPVVNKVAHSEMATKFWNYFGLTWMQGKPPIDPICHPPCDGAKKIDKSVSVPSTPKK